MESLRFNIKDVVNCELEDLQEFAKFHPKYDVNTGKINNALRIDADKIKKIFEKDINRTDDFYLEIHDEQGKSPKLINVRRTF